MRPIDWFLLGVGAGAIPTTDLAAIAVATIAKKAGLKPSDIRKYNAATSESESDADPEANTTDE